MGLSSEACSATGRKVFILREAGYDHYMRSDMLTNKPLTTAGTVFSLIGLGLMLVSGMQAQSATPPAGKSGASQADAAKQASLSPSVPTDPSDFVYISGDERGKWFVVYTVGPMSLLGSVVSAGWGTMFNTPKEYGPHWEGFGQRYGMSIAGNSVNNAMEATLGAVIKEDPRYFDTVNGSFGERTKNVVDLTFRAYHADGQRHVAYARFAAYIGGNFLSNTWRVNSEADWQHALYRSAEAFGGRAAGNATREFLPLIWNHIRHKDNNQP